MKLLFDPPQDGQVHTYCIGCQQKTVQYIDDTYHCTRCNHSERRALIIDPQVSWWVDNTGEYWHETAGVFVGDGRGRFLFFSRVKFPPGLSVPAGHRDEGERSEVAAARELFEETRVRASRLVPIAIDDIWGDTCRRGSEVHRWHSYALRIPKGAEVSIDETEGVNPVWLTLDEAMAADLTFATRFVLERHASAILAAMTK